MRKGDNTFASIDISKMRC